MTMSDKQNQKNQRIYGVDFGTRNISIAKVDIDISQYGSDSKSVTSFVSDHIGMTNIFNGVQYIKPHQGADTMTSYKVRRMGNDCVRSKPFEGIECWSKQESGLDSSFDPNKIDIQEIYLPNGITAKIDREMMMVSIVTHIRELIDLDMKKNPIPGSIEESIIPKVVFALPELTPAKKFILQWRIKQLFNIESANAYVLDFLTDTNAVVFARFNQAYPNLINREIKNESSNETILILKSGHMTTEILEVETSLDSVKSLCRIKILNRLSVPFGGKTLDNRIASITGELESSKEVEKIKLNLSMLESTRYDGDYRSINISRSDIMNDDIKESLDRLHAFILSSNARTIELVGGNTRSFVIQHLLNTISDSGRSEYICRRGLSADETTAIGASIYGAVSELTNHLDMDMHMHVELDRCISPAVVEVKSPWSIRVDINDPDMKYAYVLNMDFKLTRTNFIKYDNGGGREDSLKLMRARDLELKRGCEEPSDIRMISITASERPNRITYGDLSFDINIVPGVDVKTRDFATDLFIQLNMLDIPEVISVKKPGVSDNLKYVLDLGSRFNERYAYATPTPTSDIQVENEIRRYQRLLDRIGALYNRMESICFDRSGYQTRKQEYIDEISRIKSSYAYSQSSIDRLEDEYKKLLDTYEFCRVITIDGDIELGSNYAPDPEITVDHRLTRDAIDLIIRDEKGLDMLERMIGSN